MEKKCTLKDLAKILNLAVSTVSKAINNSSEISKATKAKVQNIALLNNYTPNISAQNLKSKRTKTIGVIVPDLRSHFFALAIHGIETEANSKGYKIIICFSNESREKESESIKTLINGRVDGLIISLSKETQVTGDYGHFEEALKYDFPIVLFDRTFEKMICDKISINDQLAAKEATEHLIKTGCQNIIFISTISGTSVGEKRKMGYLEGLKNTGKQGRILNIENYNSFEKLLLKQFQNIKVDGILAANELSAISTIKYALKNSFKIPEDISVIGFDSGVLAENYMPSLTVVDQKSKEQGTIAASTLINRLEKETPIEPIQHILKTSLIQRQSTIPLNGSRLKYKNTQVTPGL
jgi:LacI family transcriptional regulator